MELVVLLEDVAPTTLEVTLVDVLPVAVGPRLLVHRGEPEGFAHGLEGAEVAAGADDAEILMDPLKTIMDRGVWSPKSSMLNQKPWVLEGFWMPGGEADILHVVAKHGLHARDLLIAVQALHLSPISWQVLNSSPAGQGNQRLSAFQGLTWAKGGRNEAENGFLASPQMNFTPIFRSYTGCLGLFEAYTAYTSFDVLGAG